MKFKLIEDIKSINAFELDEALGLNKHLFEGVWSFPDTKEKAIELKNLLSRELPLNDKTLNKLYHIFGDDILFDDIEDNLENVDNANYYIKKRLSDILNNENINDISKEASDVLFSIINEKLERDIDTEYFEDNYEDFEDADEETKRKIIDYDKQMHLRDIKNNLEAGIDITDEERELLKNSELDEELNENVNPEWLIIETEKWYDPEGLNIDSPDSKVIFKGSKEKALVEFNKLKEKANPEYKIFVKELASNQLEIYYMLAKSKKIYTLKQNITDDLDEKLIQGKSDKTLQKNIETEIKAGKDPKQAAAIAYSIQDKAKREQLEEKLDEDRYVDLEYDDIVVTIYGTQRDADD